MQDFKFHLQTGFKARKVGSNSTYPPLPPPNPSSQGRTFTKAVEDLLICSWQQQSECCTKVIEHLSQITLKQCLPGPKCQRREQNASAFPSMSATLIYKQKAKPWEVVFAQEDTHLSSPMSATPTAHSWYPLKLDSKTNSFPAEPSSQPHILHNMTGRTGCFSGLKVATCAHTIRKLFLTPPPSSPS